MELTTLWYRDQIGKVSIDLVYHAVMRRKDVLARLHHSGELAALQKEVETMIYLMQDFIAVRYTAVSCSSLSAMAFAILYFIEPEMLVPTFISDTSQTDPEKVFHMCLSLTKTEREHYQNWALLNGRN